MEPQMLLTLFLPVALFYFLVIRFLKIGESKGNRRIWTTLTGIWVALFGYFLFQSKDALTNHSLFFGIGIFITCGFIHQNLPYLKAFFKERME